MLELRYSAKGPIVEGHLARGMPAVVAEIEHDIGDYAVHHIQQRLDQVLVNPTGRYRSSIHTVITGNGLLVEDGTVYGAWLEGVGTRNRSSRFKGYRTFRIVAQDVRREAPEIARRLLAEAIRRLS